MQGATRLVLKEEKDYHYTVEICARLKTCTQAAFAEFDSYTAQWGFSGRASMAEEEKAQCPNLPAIISETIEADLP
eukprot:1053755-Heterocapsa_arctica.AAC.1